jgi:hypothetical protein
MLIVLITIVAPQKKVSASEPIPTTEKSVCENATSGNNDIESNRIDEVVVEIPKEFTQQEYEEEIENFYKQYSDYEVVYDLYDENGIDSELLPPEISSMIDGNTKVVAYKETAKKTTAPKIDAFIIPGEIGKMIMPLISCASSSDGTYDSTIFTTYGGVDQYIRVQANRYNEYSGCDRLCYGWEFEKQWAYWTRTSSSWYIGSNSALMQTTSGAVPAENYCTESQLSLNHMSSPFTPTFYGNSTNWWSISGFADIGYVPGYSIVSRTQSDIILSGGQVYNDATSSQIFSNN